MKKFCKWYFDLFFTLGMIGCATLALDHIFDFLNIFMKGMFTSLSFVLIFFSLFFRFNKRLQKKLAVEQNDERIGIITGKSATLTIEIMTWIFAAATVAFGFFGEPFTYISLLLAIVTLIQTIVFCTTKAIISGKM